MDARFMEWSTGACFFTPKRVARNTFLLIILLQFLLVSSQSAFAVKAACDCENPVTKSRLDKYAEYWRMRLQGLPSYPRRILVVGTLDKTICSDEFLGLSQHNGGWAQLDQGGEHFIANISPYVFKELIERGVSITVLDHDLEPDIKSIPVNDECINALEIDVNVPVTGSTTEATDGDVWYRFTPVTSGDYLISLAGSDYDTQLWIYSTCDGSPIANDDDSGPGLTSQLIIGLQSSETYYIRVGGYESQTGTYQLEVKDAAGLPCYDAAAVQVDTLVTGSTVGAAESDVFFSFTPPREGNYHITLAGSDYDTQLWVYDRCYGRELAYDDDGGPGLTSQVVLTLSLDPVIIRIGGFGGSTGNYNMMITYHPAPTNDNCIDATIITVGQIAEGSTLGAIDADVWYAFTPTQTGPVVLSLWGSDFDTVLTVRDQCNGAIVASNDDNFSRQSRLSMEMVEQHTYLIQIGGFYEARGAYRLTVTYVPTPPHDTASDAIAIGFRRTYSGTTDGASTSLQSSICGWYDGLDVWHTYTPQVSGVVKLMVEGDQFDATLSVYDRFGGSTLVCNNDTCSLDPVVLLPVTEGVTYLIRVAGHNMTTGAYTVSVNPYPDVILAAPSAPLPADGARNVSVDTVLTWNGVVPIQPSPYLKQRSAKPEKDNDASVKSIYGLDDRLDEYEVDDPNAHAVGHSTAILIDRDLLTEDRRGYTINTVTLAQYIEDNYGWPLSDSEPFRNQPTAGHCSAFLVAPDVVATAGHCTPCDDLANLAIVFDFTMIDANTPKIVFNRQSVYFAAENIAAQEGEPDWGLIRLDRRVEGRMPLRIRRQGIVPEKQALVIIGYPLGIPRKYDFGGKVRDNWMPTYFSANLDAYGGNSGSAVLNADTWEVEGILVRGVRDFVEVDDFLQSYVLPDHGPAAEQVTRTTTFAYLLSHYEVYMGTDPSKMVLIDSGSTISQCQARGLQRQTTYYWQVVGVSHSGRVTGPLWSFTTE